MGELEERMAVSDFWIDHRRAEEGARKVRVLKDSIRSWETLEVELGDLRELQEMAAAESDEKTLVEVEGELAALSSRIGELELHSTLSDGDDRKNAILDIHSGAGGTEAADWAGMLMRMYMRWIERRNFRSDIMDLQAAEEAGVKSVTVEVKGEYAYGYLKAEAGVHRLVRISPFDSNSRRHTSFASVFVYPEIEDEVEVDLRDEDLQIEVFRAGGAGGQHVNKTSSAVRMRHLPTGIVVQCQNERSQFKNKATARKVLATRLYQHYKEEEQKKLAAVESSKKSIEFGSQIRSYVFHPYNMVKDHRTTFETAGIQAVMDGDIDPFIRAFLTRGKTS